MDLLEKEINALLSQGYANTTKVLGLALESEMGSAQNPFRLDVPFLFRNGEDPNANPKRLPNSPTSSATSDGIYISPTPIPANIFLWRSESHNRPDKNSQIPLVFSVRQLLYCLLTNQEGYSGHKNFILNHEGMHIQQGVLNCINYTLGLQKESNLAESPQWGCGIVLEGILRGEETPEETQRRHADLQWVYNHPNASKLNAYAVQAGEHIAILSQVFCEAIRSGSWKRLPQTKEELWAAFHGLVGEPVSAAGTSFGEFLQSERCRALKAEFPAAPLLAQLPMPTLDGASTFPIVGTIVSRLHIEETLKDDFVYKGLFKQLKSPAAQAAFYEKVLPDMYATWREATFGDLDTRSKLGLPPGNYPAQIAAFQIIYSGQERSGVTTWNRQEWKTITDKINPALHEKLLGLAIHYENPLAVDVLLEANKEAATGCGLRLTKEQFNKIAAFAEQVHQQAPSTKNQAATQILESLKEATRQLTPSQSLPQSEPRQITRPAPEAFSQARRSEATNSPQDRSPNSITPFPSSGAALAA